MWSRSTIFIFCSHKIIESLNDRIFNIDINERNYEIDVERLKPVQFTDAEILNSDRNLT